MKDKNGILPTLFTDKKNRLIYFSPKYKIGYVINKANEKKIEFFKNRLPVSITLGAIFYSVINKNILIAVVIAVVGYLFLTIYFNKKVLPSYTAIKNYEISENTIPNTEQKQKKSLFISIASILISLLLLITLFAFDNEALMTVVIIVFVVIGFSSGIKGLVDYYK